MTGELFKLAEKNEISILAFREHKSAAGFYAPNIDKIYYDDMRTERKGVFLNFFPFDAWYEKIINAYLSAEIPDYEKKEYRKDSVLETFNKCSCWTGDEFVFPDIKDAKGLDGIHYNSKEPGKTLGAERRYEKDDEAFFIYLTYKLSESVRGDFSELTETGKRLIISMAFLEADMKRCLARKDTSVLYKRAKKCAGYYLDYYYEGDTDKKSKGLISMAYSKFCETIFYLFGSNALQDDKFIV